MEREALMASKRRLAFNPWSGERQWRYWPRALRDEPGSRPAGVVKTVAQVVRELQAARRARAEDRSWQRPP